MDILQKIQLVAQSEVHMNNWFIFLHLLISWYCCLLVSFTSLFNKHQTFKLFVFGFCTNQSLETQKSSVVSLFLNQLTPLSAESKRVKSLCS